MARLAAVCLHLTQVQMESLPLSLWQSPSWCLALKLWMMSCSLCVTLHNLPSHSWPGFVGSLLGTGAPCPGRDGSHKAVISDQSFHIYRNRTWGISPSTFKISLRPIVKGLLYSLAQNFISARIPLIIQVFCWKISRESELEARASGLSFYLLGHHLPKFQVCSLETYIVDGERFNKHNK